MCVIGILAISLVCPLISYQHTNYSATSSKSHFSLHPPNWFSFIKDVLLSCDCNTGPTASTCQMPYIKHDDKSQVKLKISAAYRGAMSVQYGNNLTITAV